MNQLLVPFFIYALVTTFTPGPNNIAASTFGMKHGYRHALPYLWGMTIGFFLVVFVTGQLTDLFTRFYASLAPGLKWLGFAYMLWLAVSIFLTTDKNKKKEALPLSLFLNGLLLQFVNPKLILFGITIYGSFSGLIAGSFAKTTLSALFLTFVGLCATFLWLFTGSTLSKYLAVKRNMLVFNCVMAVLILYAAFSIILH